MIASALENWGWVVAAVAGLVMLAVVAGLALNAAATLRLLREFVGFFVDKFAAFWRWMRKPGSARRLALWVVAIVGVTAVFIAYQANQTIVVVTRERDTLRTERDTARTDLKTASKRAQTAEEQLAGFKQQEEDFASASREQALALATAREQSSKARADAAYWRKVAMKSNASWPKAYENRSDACRAATEALTAACPTLKGY